MNKEQFAEKRDALKRANHFVIVRAWVESMEYMSERGDLLMVYEHVSGYGLYIAEAQEKAKKRFESIYHKKGTGFYGGGYEIIHGKNWH